MSKKIITAAFALSLLCGTSAMAQHDDHHGGGGGGAPHAAGGGGGAPRGGGEPHGGGGGGAPHFAPGGGPRFAPSGGGEAHFNGGAGTAHANSRASERTSGYGGERYSGNHANHVRTGVAVGVGALAVGAAVHAGAHPHYSAQAYPHAIQPERQYHYNGAWNPPRGFYYRHWGYGDHLPYGWYARPYWISDFDLYGLAPAPYGYEWVREGPDALLVNVYNGRVVEVEYGLFY